MVVRVQLRHSFSLDIRNDGKQLFHLKKDPAESQDRWQQEPEIAHHMNLTLQQLKAKVPPPITPRTSHQLQKARSAILNTVQGGGNLPNGA